MKRALVATVVLMGSSAVASAGGFVGLGIGPDANVYGTDGTYSGSGRSYRLLGGLRFGRLSVEAALTGQSLLLLDNPFNGDYRGKQLSLAGKYNLPLGSNFEAFGKAGVHRTWLSGDDSRFDVSGDGLLVGGGFEYRLGAALASGSIWVDYTHHAATLAGDNYSFEAGVGMWMLGFTVGI